MDGGQDLPGDGYFFCLMRYASVRAGKAGTLEGAGWSRCLLPGSVAAVACILLSACGAASLSSPSHPVTEASPCSGPATKGPPGVAIHGVCLASPVNLDGGRVVMQPATHAFPKISASQARLLFDGALNEWITHPTLLLAYVTIGNVSSWTPKEAPTPAAGPGTSTSLPGYTHELAWAALAVGQQGVASCPLILGSPSPTRAVPPAGDPPLDPSPVELYVLNAMTGRGMVDYRGPSLFPCTGTYSPPQIEAVTATMLLPWTAKGHNGGHTTLLVDVPACTLPGSLSAVSYGQWLGLPTFPGTLPKRWKGPHVNNIVVVGQVSLTQVDCFPARRISVPLGSALLPHGPTGVVWQGIWLHPYSRPLVPPADFWVH